MIEHKKKSTKKPRKTKYKVQEERNLLSELVALKEKEIIEKGGFFAFVLGAWNIVEPEPYEDSWHIREFCSALESVALDCMKGISRNLVICVPPGSTKTLIASILFQPWVWTFWPKSKWLSATFEISLAGDQSRKSRDLVLSDWYQDRWPMQLTKDGEIFWENEFGGSRKAAGTGGAVTGRHTHFHIGDDLVKEQQVRFGTPDSIQETLNEANGFWFGTMATRKARKNIARILIGQRMAEGDPQGVAIKKGYESIVFPVHFDPERKDPKDHRTKKGDLLCSRYDDETLLELKSDMGTHLYICQYEQLATSLRGSLLKAEYFNKFWPPLPTEIDQTIRSCSVGMGQRWITAWDMAFKGLATSTQVCGQVWVSYQGYFILIDQILGHAGFLDTLQFISTMVQKYPWVKKHIMEDAANAPAVYDVLKDALPGIALEPMGGGTLARTQSVEGVWESGRVVLPEKEFILSFISDHLSFSENSKKKPDPVSTSSLALVHLSNKNNRGWAKAMKALLPEKKDNLAIWLPKSRNIPTLGQNIKV